MIYAKVYSFIPRPIAMDHIMAHTRILSQDPNLALWYGIHGLLMALGWLVFVPAAVYLATVGKRDQLANHQYYHRIMIYIGLTCIVVGGSLGFYLTDHHFAGIHQILGPFFNVAIIAQTLTGLTAIHLADDSRLKAGLMRILHYSGMLVYYGGTTNAFFGMLLYQHCFVADGPIKNALFFTAGIIFLIEAYLLAMNTMAWYENGHPEERPRRGTGYLSLNASSEALNNV